MGNDEERYRRFLEGDDNGLREIIEIYYSGLMLYINGLVNDVSETQDIVQETFVKLAVKKPKFRKKYKFKTWLFTIARNQAYNHLNRYRARLSDTQIEECTTISDGVDIEKEYLQTTQNIQLHQAMKQLIPDYFQALHLMYFEDFDISDIAAAMHRSDRQISELLYRAKKSLRSKLEKGGFQYEDY